MSTWSSKDLIGPEGEDWRVPVSELEARQLALSAALRSNGQDAALIQHPVDLYYFSGGRSDSSMLITADEASPNTLFVRRSLKRAKWESGGNDSPHVVEPFPRLSTFAEHIGCTPSLQLGEVPHGFASRFQKALNSNQDCTSLIHSLREIKSDWELEQMSIAADIQISMFEAIYEVGEIGMTELELVATAEAVSRASGFGGNVQMRRFPLQCDRGVIVAGRAGGIPSFFDSAVGGTGPHPLSGMGAGFSTIKSGEPILVDLVHAHRGYVVDMTRMFSAGSLSEEWQRRLDDMIEIRDIVVDSLGNGEHCSESWEKGFNTAVEMGYADHLMGLAPDQSRFLGHSVGLQLDESPVVAKGFDRELPEGGVMAIEPKLVYQEGSIGTEDTWVRTSEGMQCISAGSDYHWIQEW